MTRKIKWCSNCRVPIAGETCSLCGNTGRICARDLKPIFSEERELYEKLLGVKLPLFAFRHRNRIIAEGKTFLTFKIDTQNRRLIPLCYPRNVSTRAENEDLEKEMKYLIEANIDLLKEREQKAISFIKSISEKYLYPIVLFGGGKDSGAVAILAKRALGNVPLLFIDTTLEFPETYEFVERFSKIHRFPLIKDKGGEFYKARKDFFYLCEKIGPPSVYCRWCCHIFKEQPVKHFIDDNSLDWRNIVFLTGIRKSESRRRRNYSHIEIGKRIFGQILVQPINDWSDFEIWLYTFWRKIEINNLYRIGHTRVGCWPCPCAPPFMDFIRRITHPHLWNIFEEKLYKYAKENCRSERWVKEGLWRLRRPKRQKEILYPAEIVENNADKISFKYILPFKTSLFEFSKIIGRVNIHQNHFAVKTERGFELKGQIFGDQVELIVECARSNYGDLKNLIEKVLFRSINCIRCGACSSSCPKGALKIVNGNITILENCDNCGLCLRSSCVTQDSERLVIIKLDPFSITPCEKGLSMNHLTFIDKELGIKVANRLKEKGVNVEIHEEGKIICVDARFPKSEIEPLIRSQIRKWLLFSN